MSSMRLPNGRKLEFQQRQEITATIYHPHFFGNLQWQSWAQLTQIITYHSGYWVQRKQTVSGKGKGWKQLTLC